jgi:hypothetical protein
MSSSAAPIDDAVLETIAERARTHSLIETVQTERTGEMVSMVVAILDSDRYPPHIEEVRLEIQWYTNGDYNFHYVETQESSDIWQCRWDRHPNSHTQRIHFHPPPAARSNDAVPDSPADHHPSALFTRTLANIRQRIESLWNQVN